MGFEFKMPNKVMQTKDDSSLTSTEQTIGKTPELKNMVAIGGLKPITPISNLKPIGKPATVATKVTATKDNSLSNVDTSLVKISDDALSIINEMPISSFKDSLKEVADLEALAREFQNEEQPDKFDDAATKAVHEAVLQLEKSIDNAEEVRTQITFIMTEIQKFPAVAAKICDNDISIMVKALRQNYNTVAFTKKINKTKSKDKESKAIARVKDLLDDSLFDGLGI